MWRKAGEEERKGLQADIKQRLTKLRRAESLRKLQKKKEWERTVFLQGHIKKNPTCPPTSL